MWFTSWPRNCKPADAAEHCRPHRAVRRRATFRPRLELLEDRTLLSSYTAATTSDLIADINAANKAGGTNTIMLAPNTTFNLTAVNNTGKGLNSVGANGLPVIGGGKTDNLTIMGNGDTIERGTAAGTPAFRLFDVAQGNALTLENVTLQNGLAQGSGTAATDGGGIFNAGTLTVSGSTLSGNSADQGGGIYNAGSLEVNGSTLSDNHGSYGGGIQNFGALTVSGGTLSGNSAIYNGGGIWTNSTATVSGGCTLSGNSAHCGGGIYNVGTVTVENSSSITGNSAPLGFGADVYNLGVLNWEVSTSPIGILDGTGTVVLI